MIVGPDFIHAYHFYSLKKIWTLLLFFFSLIYISAIALTTLNRTHIKVNFKSWFLTFFFLINVQYLCNYKII